MSHAVTSMMSEIHATPFNHELASGDLPKEKFQFYLQQDALYLADYARALAITGARLASNHHAQQFIQFSLGAINAERELHAEYLQDSSLENISDLEQSPFCFIYTNYLLKMASLAPVEEAVASLLPCFWVYKEVGKHIAAKAIAYPHPYQDWIALYSGTEFCLSVDSAITITNELGCNSSETVKKNMLTAFKRSTQLEWNFWVGAYAQEKWHTSEIF